ncbi:MAG TPA: CPBP family intramembrane glutamic endopeptidase [Acidobacteriota bacterium]|nr:CPBP family intramembrane glutamic endopeptidase [Acidobacteriota bacterium]
MERVTPDLLLNKGEVRFRWQRILQFPLLELVVAGLFMAPVALAHNAFAIAVLEKLQPPLGNLVTYLEHVVNVVLFLLAYALYCRWVERRKPFEISGGKSVPELSLGFAGGIGLVGIMVGLLSLLGYYRVSGFSENQTVLIDAFFRFGIGAFLQEFFIRLLLFRLTEELVGTWSAVVIVAVSFGLIHIGNENATPLTSVMIAVSDVLYLAAFVFTRRLWLVWGLHFGWNFMQDGVFGMPNSGETALPSWIRPDVTGPDWLTGGSFGIEASIVAIALQVALGLWLLLYARKLNQFMAPYWQRIRR